ncbi:MAG: ABC transporter permease [Planctomycetes bacterium]|nr:ABC transporter permease [Planctomycetota bacterium]
MSTHVYHLPAAPASTRRPKLPWLLRGLPGDLAELFAYRFVLYNLVTQELKVRYQRSVLGFFWTLLNPILMMAVLATVFSHLISMKDYALYLFAGMLPWVFFATSVDAGANCLIRAEGLIRKVYLPKMLFPIAAMLINLINLSLSMMALFLLLQVIAPRVSWSILTVPPAMVLLAVFTLGIGMLVATVNTFFRDFGHIVTVLLQAWYFLTPVIYSLDVLSEKLRRVIVWNPMSALLHLFHCAIYYRELPSGATVGYAVLSALVSLGIGYAAFKYHEDRFIFRL